MIFDLDYSKYTELNKNKKQKSVLIRDGQKMQELFDKIDNYSIETPYLKTNNITDVKLHIS